MGVEGIFSRGATIGFPKIFLGEAKSGDICFFPLETIRKPFLLQMSKSPLPTLMPPCVNLS